MKSLEDKVIPVTEIIKLRSFDIPKEVKTGDLLLILSHISGLGSTFEK